MTRSTVFARSLTSADAALVGPDRVVHNASPIQDASMGAALINHGNATVCPDGVGNSATHVGPKLS